MSSPPARRWRAAGFATTLFLVACLAVLVAQVVTPGRAVSRSRPRVAAFRSAHHVTAAAIHRDHRFVVPPPPLPPTPITTASTTTTSTTTTTGSTTTPTTAAPAPTTTTTTAPPQSPPAPAPAAALPVGVPPKGQATQWGCAAALAYLTAYAYPGFTLECPGNAEGREGMTCKNWPGVCPGQLVIAIADPCPAAYMNEASNSWVLMGASTAPEDPYGTC